MDLLQSLTDRSLIMALALVGAVVATAGSVVGQRQGASTKLARILMWSGYSVSLGSVGAFIIAGFLK